MQPILIDMIENKIKIAKFKLSQHKLKGQNSELSIFQVATLMDLVKMNNVGDVEQSKNNFLYN